LSGEGGIPIGIIPFSLLWRKRKWWYVATLAAYGILNFAIFWSFAFIIWMLT
jgi:hypothetical protein